MIKGSSARVASFVGLFVIWLVAALFLSDTILPSPSKVFATIWKNLHDAKTYVHIYKTVIRVVFGMGIALVLGLMVGVAMGLSRTAERILDSWVMVTLTVPAVVYGIIAILWFGLNDRAAIIAIGFTSFPSVAINMWQGVKAIDMSLIHMGRAFRLSRNAIIRKVVLPQTVPYVLAALRYALGIAWKICTTVELIGMSSGVGYMLHYWFGMFSMTQVFAWTITFTIILLLIEFLVLKPTERWVTRWRPNVQT